MVKLIKILILLVFGSAAFAYDLPPDFDFDHEHVYEPPQGLAAGWTGDNVYLTWHATKDLFGNYVDGYRLYRAADKDSIFVQVKTDLPHNLILSANYFDHKEALEEAGITPSEEFFYKVTAVVIGVEVIEDEDEDEDNEAMLEEVTGKETLYESLFSGPVGVKRGADISCFISTAAYGTPLAREVILLSRFRDNIMVQNLLGEKLAGIYETLSPRAADIIKSYPFLCAWARLHIAPIVSVIRIFLIGQPPALL